MGSSQNVLKRISKRKKVTLTFNDKKYVFKMKKGFLDIAMMLKNPGKAYTPEDLIRIQDPAPDGEVEVMPEIDQELADMDLVICK